MNINQKHVRMHEAHMNTLRTQRSIWPSQPTSSALLAASGYACSSNTTTSGPA